MKKYRVFLSLIALFCVSVSLVACGEPLDHAPLSELPTEEKKQATTGLQDTMWENYAKPTFGKVYCRLAALSLMYGLSHPETDPQASAACTDLTSRCEQAFQQGLEKSKADYYKQTIDFSKCNANYSEVVACINKAFSALTPVANQMSCGDVSTWKTLKDHNLYQNVDGCEEIMKTCPITAPQIRLEDPNPAP